MLQTKKETVNISINEFMNNLLDLLEEDSSSPTQIVAIQYSVAGGPLDVDVELDHNIKEYMQSIGWSLVGQGCGFGIRDLEFEGGDFSINDLRKHCLAMMVKFGIDYPLIGNIVY